jgi:hypothetical protein
LIGFFIVASGIGDTGIEAPASGGLPKRIEKQFGFQLHTFDVDFAEIFRLKNDQIVCRIDALKRLRFDKIIVVVVKRRQ